MKSQRAEREAQQAASRPRIEAKLVTAEYVSEVNHRLRCEAVLEKHLNEGWQIQTCAADASGCNLTYTLIRSVAPEPVAHPGIPVR